MEPTSIPSDKQVADNFTKDDKSEFAKKLKSVPKEKHEEFIIWKSSEEEQGLQQQEQQQQSTKHRKWSHN